MTKPCDMITTGQKAPDVSRSLRLQIGIIMLFLIAALLPAIIGCQPSHTRGRPHTFLIVGTSQDDPLWPVIQGGAQAYAHTFSGLNLKMLAPATDDPAAQADLVRRNLDPSVFAVCLQATACEQTRQLVKDLTGRGVSVVLIGQDMPDTPRLGYVGLDDTESGRLLAGALRSSMQDRTTFMVLHAGEGDTAYGLRLRGFGDGMTKVSGLRELHRMSCDGDPAKALRILNQQNQKYPDLAMWVSVGDWPAHIKTKQLQEALGPETRLVMIGATPPVWPLLEQGIVRATIATNYGWWGYEAANLAELAYRRAQAPDNVRLTAPRILRPDDLPEFREQWKAWTQGHVLPAQSQPALP